MALVYCDSFDTYQTTDILKRWTVISGSPTIAASGRTSSSLEINATSEYVRYGLPNVTTYFTGAALKVASLPLSTGWFFLSFDGISLSHVMLRLESTGAISAYRVGLSVYPLSTNNVTNMYLLGSSDGGVISSGNWFYIESKLYVNTTAGTVDVRVNGVPVLALTGLNTYGTTATGNIGGISIGRASDSGTTYWDDVYICDTTGSVNNSFLGDVTVEPLFPQTDAVAAGTHEDFTCSTGVDQGAMVNESATDFPDEDTTYIYSSTVGHQSTFNYPAITPVAATICGVQVNICAKKSTTGTRTYKSLAKLAAGAATEGSGTFAPSDSSYAYGCDIWETKPGGGAWTVSDVNGAEFGVTVEA